MKFDEIRVRVLLLFWVRVKRRLTVKGYITLQINVGGLCHCPDLGEGGSCGVTVQVYKRG